MIGDLNEIMYPFEKEEGRPRPEHCMEAFRDAVDDCQLSDLGHEGDIYTWHRREIRERLERALSSEDWSNMFADAKLESL